MERLTETNGNGYIQSIIDGEIVHIKDENTLKLAKKLKYYEDLEEQGLLLRLPCRVGASVYMVVQDCGGDTLYCRRGDCEGCPNLYSFVEENTFEAYMCDEIGKTVFLTKEEAEQKLKEMESVRFRKE